MNLKCLVYVYKAIISLGSLIKSSAALLNEQNVKNVFNYNEFCANEVLRRHILCKAITVIIMVIFNFNIFLFFFCLKYYF